MVSLASTTMSNRLDAPCKDAEGKAMQMEVVEDSLDPLVVVQALPSS